jgi:hypothetical protein
MRSATWRMDSNFLSAGLRVLCMSPNETFLLGGGKRSCSTAALQVRQWPDAVVAIEMQNVPALIHHATLGSGKEA